jgi:hypothetical protein
MSQYTSFFAVWACLKLVVQIDFMIRSVHKRKSFSISSFDADISVTSHKTSGSRLKVSAICKMMFIGVPLFLLFSGAFGQKTSKDVRRHSKSFAV